MHIVQLMASPFFGGPERQVLGLAQHLPTSLRTTFLSFAEKGKANAFLEQTRIAGFASKALVHNFPHLGRAIAEVADELRNLRADVVCCNGYKPDLIGWRAARRVGIPVVSISHGWTGATWKVRVYEALDRFANRHMDAVVCVSEAQAEKVRRARVPEAKIVTIRNAVANDAFQERTVEGRSRLLKLFAKTPRLVVGAAGRLSPEKGFTILLEAARQIAQQRDDVGFVLFGEGPLRAELEQQHRESGLGDRFVFAGFRSDVPSFLPHLDLGVMSSFTEGLPVILLEMFAAGVPVVASAVGGIPEVIEENRNGALVPPGDASALARRMLDLLRDDVDRAALGEQGRNRVRADFTFHNQSLQYQDLFARLVPQGSAGNLSTHGLPFAVGDMPFLVHNNGDGPACPSDQHQ